MLGGQSKTCDGSSETKCRWRPARWQQKEERTYNVANDGAKANANDASPENLFGGQSPMVNVAGRCLWHWWGVVSAATMQCVIGPQWPLPFAPASPRVRRLVFYIFLVFIFLVLLDSMCTTSLAMSFGMLPLHCLRRV